MIVIQKWVRRWIVQKSMRVWWGKIVAQMRHRRKQLQKELKFQEDMVKIATIEQQVWLLDTQPQAVFNSCLMDIHTYNTLGSNEKEATKVWGGMLYF